MATATTKAATSKLHSILSANERQSAIRLLAGPRTPNPAIAGNLPLKRGFDDGECLGGRHDSNIGMALSILNGICPIKLAYQGKHNPERIQNVACNSRDACFLFTNPQFGLSIFQHFFVELNEITTNGR